MTGNLSPGYPSSLRKSDICYSYDFDKDGFIRKEDVRLILSHVPIDKNMMKI
jgi:hypothetical protein